MISHLARCWTWKLHFIDYYDDIWAKTMCRSGIIMSKGSDRIVDQKFWAYLEIQTVYANANTDADVTFPVILSGTAVRGKGTNPFGNQ